MYRLQQLHRHSDNCACLLNGSPSSREDAGDPATLRFQILLFFDQCIPAVIGNVTGRLSLKSDINQLIG